MTKIEDYGEFFRHLPPETRVILSGGDGTLNRFINDTSGLDIPQDIYYYAAGSGNDFLRDLGRKPEDGPFPIGEYLRALPVVIVNGKQYRFLNGIGYGIDGYCCQVGDEQREKSTKPVNYTAMPSRDCCSTTSPRTLVVTVDGETHSYRKVWLAPTMNGRFYGGGMMPTAGAEPLKPGRDGINYGDVRRGKAENADGVPSIFKGEHIRHKEMVAILTGHTISVEFDRPKPIQIDGETILGVSGYSVTGACEPVVA